MNFSISISEGICLNRCVFCYVPYLKEKTFMKLESFKKIISLNKDYKNTISIISLGESLLHPQFNEIIDIVNNNKNYILKFIPTTLRCKNFDKIYKSLSSFQTISIEFGGTNNQTKTQNTSWEFDEFKKNLDILVNYLESINSNTILEFKMIINKNNYQEKEKLYEIRDSYSYKNIIVDFFEVEIYDDFYLKNYINSKCKKELNESFFWNNNFNNKYSYKHSLYNKEYNDENNIYYYISAFGKVYMCNTIFCTSHEEFSIGDAYINSLYEIKNSEKHQQILFKIKNKTYTEYCSHCKFCDF